MNFMKVNKAPGFMCLEIKKYLMNSESFLHLNVLLSDTRLLIVRELKHNQLITEIHEVHFDRIAVK